MHVIDINIKFMHLNIFTFCLSALFFYCQTTAAQKHTGFWEVTEVRVGGAIKTPVAKWTKINPDGSFQSGNGWLQNSEGTWQYDEREKTFLALESNGKTDEYGAFQISFRNDTMIWERDEDGERVVVMLQKITKLPKSPADVLVGIWDLDERLKNDHSEKAKYDPQNQFYLFIRWDRVYVERISDGKKTYGYWHLDGHKPELTLISKQNGNAMETWTIEVNEAKLKMVGMSESNKNIEMIFSRLDKVPD